MQLFLIFVCDELLEAFWLKQIKRWQWLSPNSKVLFFLSPFSFVWISFFKTCVEASQNMTRDQTYYEKWRNYKAWCGEIMIHAVFLKVVFYCIIEWSAENLKHKKCLKGKLAVMQTGVAILSPPFALKRSWCNVSVYLAVVAILGLCIIQRI